MKIDNIFIGGWFQRTMLQLTEMYDFFRGSGSKLKLDEKKLEKYRQSLGIGNLEYNVAGEEYILFTTVYDINVKIFEDGLIILNNTNVNYKTLFADMDKLTEYYEKRYLPR